MEIEPFINLKRGGHPDLFLFLTVFILSGFGLAMCYSASAVCAGIQFNDPFYFFKRQMIWFVFGMLIMLVASVTDYHKYLKCTGYMLLVSFGLLAALLIPGIGHSAKGAARWLNLGAFSIQPSEFVKVFAVIYLAKSFSSENRRNHVLGRMFPLAVTAGMFLLILNQPDFSTAMELVLVAFSMMVFSGFPKRYFFGFLIAAVPMIYWIIYLSGYRRKRLISFWDPWKDRFGDGYHIIQSFTAFKKGGLSGTGIGFGTQKLGRLPEPHNDFVFAVIAEELGLIGTALLLGLFCFLFIRIMLIAGRAADDFGKLLAAGLGLLIAVEVLFNIGVVTGCMPATGLPLPFISYGGSSFLATMFAMGIILNISRFRSDSGKAAFGGFAE